ncbi:nitroreductase family protein [Corynebacterium sp. A21]|uniref:nitroreductase family protein n=1 Tax=Corynebacterium sp. A21 TaxID=3457318 RepID=UPI003FD02558
MTQTTAETMTAETSVREAIISRRATRKYTEQLPSTEVVDRIAELSLEAPSAFNAQLRDLVIVRDPEVKQALFEASGQKQFLAAPVIFITVARAEVLPEDAEEVLGERTTGYLKRLRESYDEAGLRESAMKDAMLLAGFVMVAAQSEGLATSPTTGWDEEEVKAALGLAGRPDRAIGLVIAAGYPAEFPEHPGRAASRRVDERY